VTSSKLLSFYYLLSMFGMMLCRWFLTSNLHCSNCICCFLVWSQLCMNFCWLEFRCLIWLYSLSIIIDFSNWSGSCMSRSFRARKTSFSFFSLLKFKFPRDCFETSDFLFGWMGETMDVFGIILAFLGSFCYSDCFLGDSLGK
jgi:hypothetical protein